MTPGRDHDAGAGRRGAPVMPSAPSRRRVLDEHVALVIGGGRGIGAATSVLLGRLGASVAIAARTGSEVSRVSELVRAEGGTAMPWTVDVRRPEQVQQMADQVLRKFGRLDHVVHCPGHLPDPAFVWDVDPHQLRAALEVNVLGPVLVARHVVPIMLEQGAGNLVFVSSALSSRAVPGLGAYAASRAAENVLVRTLAAEVRGSGVRVDVFTPPATDTDALRQFRAALAGRGAPVSVMAAKNPDDVAEAIVRLCLPGSWRPADGAGSRAGYGPSFPGDQRRPVRRYPW
jgi:NAD(P)-dependent dehydrogenase (short-subunit alcohol dehydrogenase family)